ncbi:acetyltransferase (GNAT) family domain-containing protein [Purpureocillium lavendulum]|uniref:Acetyltransferase (GNAT) family domain-containing protein n=1 Tax=Purpureocillium lavendulum TaxID=1247861 RepID=A0AB34G1D1_9HYPO|nr:acetyltransferase (GNAT) family domain-containing protein [Purpureocillium lavendulum]
MSPPRTVFHVRDAGLWPHDADFMVAAFDSTIPHLAAAGNVGQWGDQPFSDKDGFVHDTHEDVRLSEAYRLTGVGQPVRTFIAEVRIGQDDNNNGANSSYNNDDDGVAAAVDGGGSEHGNGEKRRDDHRQAALPTRTTPSGARYLPVGLMTIRDGAFSRHVSANLQLRPHTQRARDEHSGGFIYIDVVVTDFRAGRHRVGAGAALLRAATAYARDRGRRAVYLDCWTGGTRKLVPYYESFGFQSVQDFAAKRKDGSVWPGKLMRLDLHGE